MIPIHNVTDLRPKVGAEGDLNEHLNAVHGHRLTDLLGMTRMEKEALHFEEHASGYTASAKRDNDQGDQQS